MAITSGEVTVIMVQFKNIPEEEIPVIEGEILDREQSFEREMPPEHIDYHWDNPHGWQLWAPAFLTALRNSGNVRASAQKVGISRRLAYKVREEEPEFKKLFDDAQEDAIDLLEAMARKRAMEGDTTLLIFMLKSLRRSVYGDRLRVDNITIEQEAVKMAELAGVDPARLIEAAQRIASGALTKAQ